MKLPSLAFLADGYVVHEALTNKTMEFFRDPRYAPDWADTIPNYAGLRAAEKRVDYEADRWVHFWQTQIVKADIRRGTNLAKLAASMLVGDKEHDLSTHLERVQQRQGDKQPWHLQNC
jgi:hypothetical protein